MGATVFMVIIPTKGDRKVGGMVDSASRLSPTCHFSASDNMVTCTFSVVRGGAAIWNGDLVDTETVKQPIPKLLYFF